MKLSSTWVRAASAVAAVAIVTGGLTPAAVAADPDTAHSGDYAVTASLGGAGTWDGIYQFVDYEPGVTYTYSGWVRGSGTLALNPLDESWANIAWHSVDLTDTWAYIEGAFTVDSAQHGVFRVVDSSSAGDRTFWVDDLSVTADGAEVLADGGFEGETDPWTYAANWVRAYAPAPVVPTPTDGAHSGDYAARAVIEGDTTWSGPSQWVPLEAGVEYTFSAWLRGEGTVAFNVQDNVSWGNALWQNADLMAGWTRVEATFTPTVTAPHYVRVVDVSPGPSTLWLDDLSLTAAGGPELLADPRFEDDATAWEWPSPWTREYAPAAVGVAHGGTYAVAGTLSGEPTWSGISQFIELQAGVQYTFSGWFRGQGTLGINIQDPGWSNVVWQNYDLTGDWTYVAYPVTPTQSGIHSIRVVDASSTVGTAYVDDLSFAQVGGDELLADPGFEADDSPWELATGWSRTSGGSPYGSFTDDDFTLVLDQSANIGLDTGQATKFEGDAVRATRTTADDGWLVWRADVDLVHVSLPVYNHTDNPAAALTLAASPDGTTWRDIAVQQYKLPNAGAGEWPLTVNESTDFRPGDRYLRVTISNADPSTAAWGAQVARLYVNNRVQPVTATPEAGRIDEPVEVTLTTGTPGATIYYRVGQANVQRYAAPISLERGVITAWATATGYVSSVVRTLAYTTTADLKVDRYGQLIAPDYEGKVTSDDDLVADVAADEAYYDSLTPPTDRDGHGGLAGSGADLGLTATGFFHVENHDGRSYLVSPEGNVDFSLGLTGLGYTGDTYTQVAGREYVYDWLPTDPADPLNAAWYENGRTNYSFYVANRIRKTGGFDPTAYYQEMVRRAQKWGFNTAGAFSAPASYDENTFTNVDFLPMPTAEVPGTKLYDIFKPGLEDALDAAFGAYLTPERVNDPSLLGYMTFNEIDYDKLRTAIPAAKASVVGSKGALVDLLAQRYAGDIVAFDAAWGLAASSFDELRELSFAPTTDAAVADMDAFTDVYLDRFYGLVAEVFHRYDTQHMLIGDRWLANVVNDSKLRIALSTAAGRYIDALSYNYYTYDLSLSRVQEMYEASGGKPLILTEFHYADPTHGLITGVRFAEDETDKGLMYRNYVEKSAASGMVIGTHWFIALDQAATGRWYEGYNGEAGGIGVLDVTDRPYKSLLEQMMTTNYQIYDVLLGEREPYQHTFSPAQGERDANKTTQIPRAAQGAITLDGVLDGTWPDGPTLEVGELDRVLGIAKAGLEADFRLAWDDANLYVHADVTDDTPMVNFATGWDIWNGDAIEVFVGPENVDQGGAIQLRDTQLIVKGAPDADGTPEHHWYNNRVDQPAIAKAIAATDHGYAIEAAIPLESLHLTDAADGRELRFDIGFDDAATNQRERQFLWNGVDGNANNREKWGRATLVDVVRTPAVVPGFAEAPAGGTLPVDLSGFAPGAQVALALDGPVDLGSYTVGDDGTAAVEVAIPVSVAPGANTLTATVGGTVVASAGVTVTPRLSVAPAVTQQPEDVRVRAGRAATFTAAADGYPAPTVRWQVRVGNRSHWHDVPGATTATLEITARAPFVGTQYRAVFTNEAGTVATRAATMTVLPRFAALPPHWWQPRFGPAKPSHWPTRWSSASAPVGTMFRL